MMGALQQDGTMDSNVKGLYTLTVESIFSKVEKKKDMEYRIKVSFLEIYNEKIKDLLVTDTDSIGKSLDIQEDSVKGIVVQDLTEIEVTNVEQVQQLIIRGNL